MVTILKVYPKPSLEDDLLAELLATLPDSKFYNRLKVMVPYSLAPVPFIVETSDYAGIITVSVNGREQFRGSPAAPLRIPLNPLRILTTIRDTSLLPTLDKKPELKTGDLIIVDSNFVTARGKVTMTKGSTAVTGVGSKFTQDLVSGSYIRPIGNMRWYKVGVIVSDTSLSLTTPFLDDTTYSHTFEFQDNTPTTYNWTGARWEVASLYREGVVFKNSAADILGYHIEMEIPLQMDRGINTITVNKLGTEYSATIIVGATTWVSVLQMFARSMYKNVFLPLEQETKALHSPWSPRFIEHLLNYRDILPDLKNPHIHAIKLAVKASMIRSGTNQGVKDFVAALTYNNPVLKQVSNKDFFKVGARLFSRQDERAGVRFHSWLPSLEYARWYAFAKLIENVPSVTKLAGYSEEEIDVLAEGLVERLEQNQASIMPNFRGIIDSMPRVSASIFMRREVQIPFVVNSKYSGLNNAVQVPFSIRILDGAHTLTGAKLHTNDGIDVHAPEHENKPGANNYAFGWFRYPVNSTRFVPEGYTHPIPTLINSRSGLSREVPTPSPLTSMSVEGHRVGGEYVVTITVQPLFGYNAYNFDAGDGRCFTLQVNTVTFRYKRLNQDVVRIVKACGLGEGMIPSAQLTAQVTIPHD